MKSLEASYAIAIFLMYRVRHWKATAIALDVARSGPVKLSDTVTHCPCSLALGVAWSGPVKLSDTVAHCPRKLGQGQGCAALRPTQVTRWSCLLSESHPLKSYMAAQAALSAAKRS